MKTIAMLFLALLLGGVCFIVQDSEAGQLCWGFESSGDIIKVSTTPTLNGHTLVNGYIEGPTPYRIPVIGTFENDLDNTKKRLSLNGTNHDDALFNGEHACILDAEVLKTGTPKYEGAGAGSAKFRCGSGITFVVDDNLVRIHCTTLAPLGVLSTFSIDRNSMAGP